jgi:hypothetical protein
MNKVKGMTYSPNFETTVKGGLPVGVVIESYIPYRPPTWWEPPEGPEIEWFFIDSKGYRADWLLDQLTENEVDHVETELYEHCEEQRRLADY